MVTNTVLSPQTSEVLKRLPRDWYDEHDTIATIANALHTSPAAVRGSLLQLRRLHLVERRTPRRDPTVIEIRKIGR